MAKATVAPKAPRPRRTNDRLWARNKLHAVSADAPESVKMAVNYRCFLPNLGTDRQIGSSSKKPQYA